MKENEFAKDRCVVARLAKETARLIAKSNSDFGSMRFTSSFVRAAEAVRLIQKMGQIAGPYTDAQMAKEQGNAQPAAARP